jgi:hypothetical protein
MTRIWLPTFSPQPVGRCAATVTQAPEVGRRLSRYQPWIAYFSTPRPVSGNLCPMEDRAPAATGYAAPATVPLRRLEPDPEIPA